LKQAVDKPELMRLGDFSSGVISVLLVTKE
jgi:hypothetical protein